MPATLIAGGQPIRATAPDADTVVVTFAGPVGPGVRLLDALPILPKHKLEAALAAGTFADAWGPATPPAEMVGHGAVRAARVPAGPAAGLRPQPALLAQGGRTASRCPYLDRIVLEIVPDQNAELLRLTSGATDLTHSELRPEDYVPARRAEKEGKHQAGRARRRHRRRRVLVLPEAGGQDRRIRASPSSRSASSGRRSRTRSIARRSPQTVFLGEAVPVWGPITPGNTPWFSPNVPRYPHDVVEGARAAQEHRPRGSQRQRHRRGRRRHRSALHRADAARHHLLRARDDGAARARGQGGHRARRRAAGDRRARRAAGERATTTRSTCVRWSATSIRPATWTSGSAPGGTHLWNMSQKTPATEWEAADRHADGRAGADDRSRRAGASCSTTCSGSSPRTFRCSTSRRRVCSTATARGCTACVPPCCGRRCSGAPTR